MSKEKKRRYYGNGTLLLEVDNAADAVNVDFDPSAAGLESDNVQDAIEELHGLIPSAGSVANKSPRQEDVFLGYMVQSGNWVTQTCIVKPVNRGITYHFVLPDDVIAKVEYGTDNTLGSASGNITNGQSFTVGTNTNAQRISFAKSANGVAALLTLADANEMIADGSIRVYVDDDDIITHNYAKDPMLRALSKSKYYGSSARMPLVAHTSDLHGDVQRAKRFFEYCKHYGIDECVVSGDVVMEKYGDGSDYLFAAAEKAGCHVLMAMGNHETQYSNATSQMPNDLLSDGVNYDNHFDGHVGSLGYLLDSETPTNVGYYYHDVPAKSLRFIVLDQYDGGIYGGGSTTPSGGNMSKTQLEWFIATLKSTPEGYGVIVVLHSIERAVEGTNKFYTTCPTTGNDSYAYAVNGFYSDAKRPISKIVDAFISRSLLNDSFTVKYGGAATGTITADFTSGVAEGVEFICYLNGHLHQDRVGYLKKDISGATLANNQLNINIIAGAGLPAAPDDIPVDGIGVTQDTFNVMAIDRTNKQVRIMRIGSNVKKDLTMRDYMIINYAPSNS